MPLRLVLVLFALATSPLTPPVRAQLLIDRPEGLDTVAGDDFGAAVSLDREGQRALVGAPQHPDGGAAYVLERQGTAWVEVARLDTEDADDLGSAVALSGRWAVAGDPSLELGAGVAQVYRQVGRDWQHWQTLAAWDGGFSDGFGAAVAAAPGLIAVGAPHHEGEGAVYLFRLEGDLWERADQLLPAESVGAIRFGGSLDLDGERVYVGAPGPVASPSPTGSVTVFRQDGGGWSLEQWIGPGSLALGDRNRVALSASGDRLLVGSPFTGTAGNVHVFRQRDGVWSQELPLSPGLPPGFSAFGMSVALEGGTALIGAPGFVPADVEGRLYVYRDEGAGFGLQRVLALPDESTFGLGDGVALSGDAAFGITEIPMAPEATRLGAWVLNWDDLGQGLPSPGGAPRLLAAGTLEQGALATWTVHEGRPDALAFWILGASQASVPFKGGVLVPAPDLVLPLVLGDEGTALLELPWPAGVPSGSTATFQVWISDPRGVAGFSATNGLAGLTP